MLERLEVPGSKGQRYLYEWVNEVALGADPKSPMVSFVQLTIFDAQSKQTFRCAWVTDLTLSRPNVVEVVQGARARWKIENEAFNAYSDEKSRRSANKEPPSLSPAP